MRSRRDDYVAPLRLELREKVLPLLLPSLFTDNHSVTIDWKNFDGKDPKRGIIQRGLHPKTETAIWKLKLEVNAPASAMFERLAKSTDDNWFPFVYQSKVHMLGPDWVIVQQAAKGMLSISDREMVIIRFSGVSNHADGKALISENTENKDNQTYNQSSSSSSIFYQMWTSIDNAGRIYPNLSKKSIRGQTLPGGILLKQINEKSCQITYIHNVDLKGNLPPWLLDKAASTFLQKTAIALQAKASKLATLNGLTKNK